ncbi:FtsK/SpoIIIE domain-containing protein [Streptomyces sp. NPDC087437]|uniref:FtsK/SpoIIIE domain-containing protein n=1 Tax=Streptomyces sp. NPDC087437 TaxID=3365789 RepID=UPI00382B9F35
MLTHAEHLQKTVQAASKPRHVTSHRLRLNRTARRTLQAAVRRRAYAAPFAAASAWGAGIYGEHFLTDVTWAEPLSYGGAALLAGAATAGAVYHGVKHHAALYGGTLASGTLAWSAWQVAAPSFPGLAVGALGSVLASVPYWQWLARHRLVRAKLESKAGTQAPEAAEEVLLAPDDIVSGLTVIGVPDTVLGGMERRDDGGWYAVVILPAGVAAEEIATPAREARLSSALRLPPGWVLTMTDGGSSHYLLVSAGPISVVDEGDLPARHPMLANLHEWNPWEPAPIGTDLETGETVSVTLMGNAGVLIAGMPRMGKSVLLNGLLAHLVLTRAKLILVDPKYVELYPWAPFADRFVGRDPKAFLELLLELQEEVDRRYAKLVKEDRTKATPGDGWEPIALLVDELAALIDIPETKIRAKIIPVLRDLLSRGPACGMPIILATQKPEDKVIPSQIRDMCGQRVAFATTTPQMTDTILGQGFASKGAKAHHLDEERDKGIAFMKVDGRSFRKLKTYPFEPPERREVMVYARELWPDRPGCEVNLPLAEDDGPDQPTPSGPRGRHLRAVPTFPDGSPIPDHRVPLWQAMDRAGDSGFTINDMVAMGLPGYGARTSVDGPLQQWRRAGYVVEIGKAGRAQLFALAHHTRAA